MKEPELPRNEPLRMEALKFLGILDTPGEERFDRLTRLAQRIFDVPIALISLVDVNRQWFKSCQGLSVTETGRDVSFCGHAILGNSIFEVCDASLDERFADNPLVTGKPKIRFYAGAPLSTADGHNVGTLCIIDVRPRELSLADRASLRDLADAVEEEINQVQLREKTRNLQKAQLLAGIISRFQSQFISESSREKAFDYLLEDALALTESAYGFVGEVLFDAENTPSLKTRAITNIAWNDETHALYDEYASQGMVFTNLNTLFGEVMRTGKPVLSNDPEHDPRSGGLPEGHPAMNSFLGLPCYYGGKLVAMLGIANRPKGYDESLIEFIQPLLSTIGLLVDAGRTSAMHNAIRAEFARVSMAARQTNNGVVIINREQSIDWVNDSFARFTERDIPLLQNISLSQLMLEQGVATGEVELLSSRLDGDQPFQTEFRFLGRSGAEEWFRVNWDPFYSDEANNNGKHSGFIGLFSQITREKTDAQTISDNERRLSSVIEGTNSGTWEWNVQTGEVSFNERWAGIAGYKLSELQPVSIETWARLCHPDDLKVSDELLERHFSGSLDYYNFQCRLRHKDGHWVWIHSRGRLMSRTADGKPLLMSGANTDITEQKQAEIALVEQSQHTQAVLDNMVDGIITIDERGVMLSANPAAESIFGYASVDMVGRNVSMLMPQPHRDAHDGYLRNYQTTGVAHIIGIGREVEGMRRDGSLFSMDLAIAEITREGKPMYVGMVRDISERKRMDKMKTEFIATVSHELRTPLTSISGALGLLMGGVLGEMSGRMGEMISVAHKNSLRLNFLINDLLDMEKLVAGKMTLEMKVQPLHPLLERALKDNQAYADKFDVRLILDPVTEAFNVAVNAERLQQVMANLLSNASKFSHPGGHVQVSVVRKKERVRVTVKDRGDGIPEDFRDRIFEKFAQADSSDSREKSGTGLGLAITRELIQRMNGTVGFDSIEGLGTTFWFELPLGG